MTAKPNKTQRADGNNRMAYPNTFAETALPWLGGKDVVENWLPLPGFEPV
jgi:hypothetical protein